MGRFDIYVAGPVLRQVDENVNPLRFLYGQIEAEAKLAGITVAIPREEKELANLDPREFTDEIERRIEKADAMLVMIIPRGWPGQFSNVSVACEAQMGARAKKPLAILAKDPNEVPRLLRVLGGDRDPCAFDKVDFQQLFRDLGGPTQRERSTNW
jgi:hypothetical protein